MTTATVTVFVGLLAIAIAGQQYKSAPWATTSYGALSSLSTTSADVNVFTDLSVEAIFSTESAMRLRVRPTNISAAQQQPYVVPDVVFPGSTQPASATQANAAPNYFVGRYFGSEILHVSSVADNSPLVELRDIVFAKQHVSFSTAIIAGDYLYGYGEHDYYYFINKEDNTTLSLWNTDNGTPWKKPMYGVHPVVFISNPQLNRFAAVMLLNSHAQNIRMFNGSLTFTAVGGILDVHVIMGSSPLDVQRQYHKLIGPSAVPPYWALGTHQCRWGYTNLSDIETVVARYQAAAIPLEVMWNDIDYMDKFRVFTTDPVRYPEEKLRAFVDKLHSMNMRYVQITDPGVAEAYNYSTYESGIASGAFVKTIDGKPLVNTVWPGWTVFPDFTAIGPSEWWGGQIAEYRSKIPVDGMWLDMNELGTFCAGHCDVPPGTPWSVDWKTLNWNTFNDDICMPNNCSVVDSPLNFPPLNPLYNGYELFNKTLDMTGQLALGSYYQTKAFYGLMECKASYDALLNQTGERPFLLTRASFIGSGRYTAHWTGDNSASWEPKSGGIGDSVQAVLGSNLWGIPMVGADIGGFGGTSNEELVVRWYQLGVFYTFTRNHHDLQGPAQEPYLFSEKAQSTIRDAIYGRYKLLPYIFTQLLLTNQVGGPVLRHLSMQFPLDVNTYAESTQFMFGDSLLVTPVVQQGASTVEAYVPAGLWYNLWSGEVVTAEGGLNMTFDTPLYSPLVTLLVGGTVIPVHNQPGMTVTETNASGVGLIVAMSAANNASGQVWFAGAGPVYSEADLAYVLYTSQGSLTSGSVEGTRYGFTAPLVNSALPARVNITIYFPTCVATLPTALPIFSVDGDEDLLPIYSFTCNTLTYSFPAGRDAQTTFSISWSFGSTQRGNDGTSSKTKAIVGGVVGGLAVVVVGIVGSYFWKSRKTPERQYGVM